MSRFAPINQPQSGSENLEWSNHDEYQAGFSFSTEQYAVVSSPGHSQKIVELISAHKNEPDWMLKLRLQAYAQFTEMTLPTWGADLSAINFENIHYYLRPLESSIPDWTNVPDDIKTTFERLGVPQAEREYLAGVKMQYDSEVVYGSLKKQWIKDGVIFLSMDEGLHQYPDLVKEYFGKLIPSGDNKFAALNTAMWSGGSFVYVPPGVKVTMPLQTYFRLNSEYAGQFERTLIIVDEGAKVHYVEGCFIAGTKIKTSSGQVKIEDIKTGDEVLTHQGNYKKVYHHQVRPYTGKIFQITVTGNPNQPVKATQEHPFLIVRRQRFNERNNKWNTEWVEAQNLKKNDYVCYPIDRQVISSTTHKLTIKKWINKNKQFVKQTIKIPNNSYFYKLAGYYLAEGSISKGSYLNFSFNETETYYINDVKQLLKKVFGIEKTKESHHKKNHGVSLVVCSVELCRIFEMFGTSCYTKSIPEWMMKSEPSKQIELVKTFFYGDGSYSKKIHKHGLKENIRLNTTSEKLAYQLQQLLARNNIVSSINCQNRNKTKRHKMYVCIIGGYYLPKLGKLFGLKIEEKLNNKKRATYYHIDEKYIYAPIRKIKAKNAKRIPVYNFSVEQTESYTAQGVAVHNCTAPAYSSNSLHAAVVEIFVKPGGQCQYTTVQNWYKSVYNLVTKRSKVEAEGQMIWTDFNMGSKVTMKYPSFILSGQGARGETLSLALAGAGQHQDTGSKAIHLAKHTSSSIVSKSISKGGGRTSYRGLVNIGPTASYSKNRVVCDALILDPNSHSDTYPTQKVFNNQVQLEHEASVSKVGEEQLFYLMSRGLSEEEANKMIVQGFVAPLVKKLPLEYAIEMNRLIDLEMEGSIG